MNPSDQLAQRKKLRKKALTKRKEREGMKIPVWDPTVGSPEHQGAEKIYGHRGRVRLKQE